MSVDLLNADEVARVLRVSRSRVYQLARDGRVAGAVRLGRQLRFDRDRLYSWIRQGGQSLPGGWRKDTQD